MTETTRRRHGATALALALAIVGLGASIASFVDDAGVDPTFCGEGGCATVRASAWAHPLGIPMPLFGIAFYAVAIGLAFAAPRARRVVAIAGAAWAALLVGVQLFVLDALCKLCLIADGAALLHVVAVLAGARTLRWSWRALTIGPGVVAVVGALALLLPHPAEPDAGATTTAWPAYVARAQVPNAVTIVEVVDFECPFCRKQQARLVAALAKVTAPVAIVRKMLPLAKHPHAMTAALAWCCADAQGRGDAMAALLFAAPPASLTPAGCAQLAVDAGCDRARYERDLPAAQARVDAEMAEARAAGDRALPTMYVGHTRLVGVKTSVDQLAALISTSPR